MKLPSSFTEIADEIVRFSDLSRSEVERRLWMEAVEPGWNVCRDARRFGVTWHRYDERMEQLYREGDGFIFETLFFWCRPYRLRWTEVALERILRYASAAGRAIEDVSVLALGDGTGNDSLFLADHGMRVDYYDVPGSRTFEFAVRRFQHHGMLDGRITPLPSYEACLTRHYDVVLCFEVLEHLERPRVAIADISKMLRPGGVALITEDFGDIVPHLPTHLSGTAKLVGRTPIYFLREGLALTWYAREVLFRPAEFMRIERATSADWLRLFADGNVRTAFLSPYFDRIARFVSKIPYYSG